MHGFCYRVLSSRIETGNKDFSAAGHSEHTVLCCICSRKQDSFFRKDLISPFIRFSFNRHIKCKQISWASAFPDLFNLKESLVRVKIAKVDSLKTIEHGSFCTALTDCDLRFFSSFCIGRCGRNPLRVAWPIALRQSILASHRKFYACLLTAFQRNNTVTCT